MKLVSAAEAVRQLPDGGRVLIAPGCGMPVTLCDALGDNRDAFTSLALYSGLMLQPVRLLDAVPTPFRLVTAHVTACTEPLVASGRADYLPLRYSQFPVIFAPDGVLPVDAILIQVSQPDAEGNCSLGASVSACLDLVASTPLVVAEINAQAPRTLGHQVHISQIDVACEVDRPLIAHGAAAPGALERRIAALVASLIADGDCFQIGIGAIPAAILDALGDHRDLGIHSGMICDGMVPLIEHGAVTGARKAVDRGLVVGGEVMGSEALYRWIDGRKGCAMVSAASSHGLEYVRRIDNFVAINSAIEVDLHGQVNAEWVGGRQISGIGGQFDFVEAAMYSRGGRAIVALPATAARGTASRIVRHFAAGAPVTTPRACVDFIVTEFGIADLRGQGIHARARALAAIADPRFRDELQAAVAGD